MYNIKTKKGLFFSLVSLTVIFTLGVSNIAFAFPEARTSTLAPQSAFKPLLRVNAQAGNYTIVKNAEVEPFRNEAAYLDISHLIGECLELGVSEHTLIPAIKEHIEAVNSAASGTHDPLLKNIRIDELSYNEAEKVFYLPVYDGTTKMFDYKYSLERGADNAFQTIDLASGKTLYVTIEKATNVLTENSYGHVPREAVPASSLLDNRLMRNLLDRKGYERDRGILTEFLTEDAAINKEVFSGIDRKMTDEEVLERADAGVKKDYGMGLRELLLSPTYGDTDFHQVFVQQIMQVRAANLSRRGGETSERPSDRERDKRAFAYIFIKAIKILSERFDLFFMRKEDVDGLFVLFKKSEAEYGEQQACVRRLEIEEEKYGKALGRMKDLQAGRAKRGFYFPGEAQEFLDLEKYVTEGALRYSRVSASKLKEDEGSVHKLFKNILSLADVFMPADTPEKCGSIRSMYTLITKLQASPGVPGEVANDERYKSEIGRIERAVEIATVRTESTEDLVSLKHNVDHYINTPLNVAVFIDLADMAEAIPGEMFVKIKSLVNEAKNVRAELIVPSLENGDLRRVKTLLGNEIIPRFDRMLGVLDEYDVEFDGREDIAAMLAWGTDVIRNGVIPAIDNRLAVGAGVISVRTEQEQAGIFMDTIKLIRKNEETRPIIFALGTNWIKGYGEDAEQQFALINPLIISLRRFCEQHDIVLLDRRDEDLIGAVNAEKANGKQNAKIVFLAGENIVRELSGSEAFKTLKDENDIFLAGVNNDKTKNDDYVPLVKMMALALKYAFSGDAGPQLGGEPEIRVKGNPSDKYYIFEILPPAVTLEVPERKVLYAAQMAA